MNLHKDVENFKIVLQTAAAEIGLNAFQVEKDYYVSLLLKELSQIEDVEIVFKGGTSLSKCYNIIDRFSEDIDITIRFPSQKAGAGLRKRLKYGIIGCIERLGMKLLNADTIQSDRDFNKYNVSYNKLFDSEEHMVPHIIIETLVVFQPFPCEEREVSNYVTKYLESEEEFTVIQEYDLKPFKMEIQTIDRTFIDKLFAICDYHLKGDYDRFSRHIYDVHKIWHSDFLKKDELNSLIDQVIEARQTLGKNTLSCQEKAKPNDILQEIIDTAVFKDDYNAVTTNFLFNVVEYEVAINTLQEIVKMELLPNEIKAYNMS
ncbi:nucleotidyl transferase AbiEii/AbiGii toxin family protein [Bacillus cereus]|nr:nucleotidyl transferase AbiEii/AbiGii toxin family protein [Bacillus cereus]MDA2079509.1 nucleotidyl transferase AbiEii/AbiGii toxin family protein [Bacillus cereus]MDA2085079.1 nucleotidyl transferase AbiEii/AbiGii toxin family protein [Bacillus cereus]